MAADFRDGRLVLAERPADRGDVPFLAVLFLFVVRGAFPRRCFANLFASLQPAVPLAGKVANLAGNGQVG